ncbi:MAG: hypothetical protein A2053_02695 [Deltaproteobacteria bacterium GWA2_50_8]|nr:MAG: hypothetical protein A2053_02695 [Deltaproteobacteria bacterium GWA2_50_8]
MPSSAAPTQKKDDPRVIHYAETGGLGNQLPANPAPAGRPANPVGKPANPTGGPAGSGAVVNLDQLGGNKQTTNGSSRTAVRDNKQQTTATPDSPQAPGQTAAQKPQPKIDGNTIDLRQQKH